MQEKEKALTGPGSRSVTVATRRHSSRRREGGTHCATAESPPGKPPTQATHSSRRCWGARGRAGPALQQQHGPGPPPGTTPPQPTPLPSQVVLLSGVHSPPKPLTAGKPPTPPAQLGALRHRQAAPHPALAPTHPREVPKRERRGEQAQPRGPASPLPRLAGCQEGHTRPDPPAWPLSPVPSHSPLGSVSWTPRSSLARSWAWAPSAPESASSPEALLMPARPAGCIPEGWGVSGMGGAWCERCWVWSWCWRGAGGERRAKEEPRQDGCRVGGEGRGCTSPPAALGQPRDGWGAG